MCVSSSVEIFHDPPSWQDPYEEFSRVPEYILTAILEAILEDIRTLSFVTHHTSWQLYEHNGGKN